VSKSRLEIGVPLITTLGFFRTGIFFASLVESHARQSHTALRNAGLPIEVLAYKWLLTLFSDLRMSEGDSGMPFATLLAAWDVSFMMGIEGILTIGNVVS
jgi:hypothetical protein